jgi:kynurenine/2-aminoadipate aminotransferase
MFLWIELIGVADSRQFITTRAVESKVLFVPGHSFSPLSQPSSFVRASYSTLADDQFDEAFARLARILSVAK